MSTPPFHVHLNLQPATRDRLRTDLAAVGGHDRADNRQPKPTPRTPVARSYGPRQNGSNSPSTCTQGITALLFRSRTCEERGVIRRTKGLYYTL
jgi:hypothetical protein